MRIFFQDGEAVALKLGQLAKDIGAELVGDPEVEVSSVQALEDAGPGQVSFLSNPKYQKLVETTRASAVILSPGVEVEHPSAALLKSKDPYFAFRQAVVALHGYRKHPHDGVHPKAHVDPTASVGEGTVIYPGAYVGPRAKIGRECILYPNAVVYDDCVLGDRVILHAGAVIGQDGFGYATLKGEHHKIPQAGNVVLEDDVEVGANVAIQRATMGSTVIGRGTKLSDLISVGHGTRIGAHGLIVSLCGIAGSTKIGHHFIMGSQSGVAGHLNVGDNVILAAQSGIANDVPDQVQLYGAPATPAPHGRRAAMLRAQLPEIVDRLREIEQKIEELAADAS